MHDLRQLEEEQERKDEQNRYKMRARLLAAIMIPTWFPGVSIRRYTSWTTSSPLPVATRITSRWRS